MYSYTVIAGGTMAEDFGETEVQRAQAATKFFYLFSVLFLILFLRNSVETTGCAEEYSAA